MMDFGYYKDTPTDKFGLVRTANLIHGARQEATNNYRAYGEKFAGTGEKYVAFASPDENRSVLAAYISAETQKQGELKPQADNNWRLAPIKSDTPLDIRVETAPSEKAAAFIKQKAQYPMTSLGHDDVGFALYRLDLQKQ